MWNRNRQKRMFFQPGACESFSSGFFLSRVAERFPYSFAACWWGFPLGDQGSWDENNRTRWGAINLHLDSIPVADAVTTRPKIYLPSLNFLNTCAAWEMRWNEFATEILSYMVDLIGLFFIMATSVGLGYLVHQGAGGPWQFGFRVSNHCCRYTMAKPTAFFFKHAFPCANMIRCWLQLQRCYSKSM